MALDDGRARFLEYQRSRLRIARATVVNLLFLTAALPSFLIRRLHVGPVRVVIVELLIIGLLVLSVIAAENVGDAYHWRVEDTYRMWRNENPGLAAKEGVTFPDEVPRECRRYAAVPYKGAGDNLRFLVVRTSGGEYWTFPKGRKPSKNEKGWEAASREAREEAGVGDSIDRHAVCAYRFPASDACEDYVVKAYVLSVEEERLARRGRDAKREIVWASPGKTRELLAEGRSQRYSEEHAKVVEAAIKRIEATTRVT